MSKVKKYFRNWDGDVCPICKSVHIVYANFKPFVYCGECGFIVKKKNLKEHLKLKKVENFPFKMVSVEGYNYCPIHSHEIDYELVNEIKPLCIETHNGCGNCPHCVYISEMEVKTKDGKEICRKTRTPR